MGDVVMATLFTLCTQAKANPVWQQSLFVLESLGLRLESKDPSKSYNVRMPSNCRFNTSLMGRPRSANNTYSGCTPGGLYLRYHVQYFGGYSVLQCNKQPRKN